MNVITCPRLKSHMITYDYYSMQHNRRQICSGLDSVHINRGRVWYWRICVCWVNHCQPFWCKGRVHDDVIKWKHFLRYWPFVWGIHRSCQWRTALVFSLICAWINGWGSNRDAVDLRRHRSQYDVTVMILGDCFSNMIVDAVSARPTTIYGISYFI